VNTHIYPTTLPLTEACNLNENNKPEWGRIPDVIRLFGIKRTHLFQLIAEGKIKSVSLRKRGNARGIRIISCDSVRTMLETLASEEGK